MFGILSLVSKLKLCTSTKHIYQIHGYLITTGLVHNDTFILSKFIEACSRTSLSHYGYSVFKHNQQPCIHLHNTMIKTLLQNSSFQEAIHIFNDIRVMGLYPDSYSFPFGLRAAARGSGVGVGEQVHGQVVQCGFELDVHVGIALVQMYSLCGLVRNARKVFDEMSSLSDVALWNAMVAGYVGVGDMDSGRELFEGMSSERNVISWTTIIAGYVHVGRPNDAIEVFWRMGAEGVRPDEVALTTALSACADLGALELGESIREFVDRHGFRKTIRLCNALVDMYVKSGNIGKALEVFEGMKDKNVVSWTTVMTGLAFHGLGREAIEMFSRMERSGARPNDVTFIGLLSACSHVGLVDLGWSYFNSMTSKYGIAPKIQHYGCMVDLLGRAGCLNKAEELLMRMPFEANAAIWGSLLASSRVHGNSALASKALERLSVLEPNNCGNYSLLSNTYATLGQWNEARLVRIMMRAPSVKKLAGESSIEVNNCVRTFIAGDVSSTRTMEIYEALGHITQQCKMLGCELNKQEQKFFAE